MSRAKTSLKQDQEQDLPENDQDSGTAWLTPFACFNPDTSSSKTSLGSRPRWVPAQGSLLLEQLSLTWPKQGTWAGGYAYELPTSEHPTNESESSSLLPTPNAYESTPAQGYVEEVRENLGDPHKRLYLPGRKWHAQRTLSRIVPLLPTPSATQNDGHDPEKFLERRERELAKGRNGNGFGLTLGMAVKLLPTPSANDSTGPEGETRRRRQEDGVTGGPSLRDLKNLLPTPTSSYRGMRGEASVEKGGGQDLRAIRKLLPTPTVGDSRASGNRSLPTSKAKAGTTLTDAIVREKKHLLPTPTVNDARNTGGSSQEDRRSLPMVEIARDVSGGSTPRPSYVGKESLEGVHPDQLTIEGV